MSGNVSKVEGAAGFYWNPTGGPDGDGAFEKVQGVNGAASVTSPAATYVEYENATYKYYCEAPVGTALSDSAWQVMRKTLADNTIIFAGTGAFEHAATNLAAVVALTYTLGA